MKFCKNCGSQIEHTFCTNCGPEKAEVQTRQGSTRAMWVHLYPLLLTSVSYLIYQTSANSFEIGSDFTMEEPVVNSFASYWFFSQILAFLPLFVLWLYPLMVRMSSRSSTFEKAHATASLNFQISLFIYISAILLIALVATVGTFSISISGVWSTILLWWVVVGTLGLLGLASFIFYVIAAVAGKRGRVYRYPLAINFLK